MRAFFAPWLPWVLLLLIVLAPLWWGYARDVVIDSAGGAKRFNALRGADGRRSTSKLTAFSWVVAVAAAAAFLLTRVALSDSVTLETTGLDDLNEQYLVLMGAPLATLIVAKGIVEAKVQAGQLQKPQPGLSVGRNGDGFTVDDTGRTDILDIQYLLFNAVLLVYFAVSVLAKVEVPDLPPTLVGLTGVAAAAYVAGKAASTNPALISVITVVPSPTGAVLQIRGQNLIKPAGDTNLGARVSVNGFSVESVAWEDDGTLIEVTVSGGQPPSRTTVAVTTAASTTVSALVA